ncbi:hypothetical protein [Pseudoruegeria sp. HB172150]|uniref:hypothetical protein n=1 Tax=Pseudoruegeria sp. HB172150 TaxID=2721164 RepID=UPI001552A94F|nr:hypothetical protein [Pseudoruegeria sp. HB172150]
MSPSEKTATDRLDIDANRKAIKYSKQEQLTRILWWLFWPLFRFTPRPFFWSWRVFLLRMFGASVGKNVRINPGADIFMPSNLTLGDHVTVGYAARLYSIGRITVGARATISQYAHICAGSHDISSPTFDLTRPPVTIGEDAWIAADAFVGPGRTIGRGAVVGARAVVLSDVEDYAIVSGNPAEPRGYRVLSDKP